MTLDLQQGIYRYAHAGLSIVVRTLINIMHSPAPYPAPNHVANPNLKLILTLR